MTIIILATAAAVLFGISNGIAFNRGNNAGYDEGFKEGIKAEFRKIHGNNYEIVWGKEEDKPL